MCAMRAMWLRKFWCVGQQFAIGQYSKSTYFAMSIHPSIYLSDSFTLVSICQRVKSSTIILGYLPMWINPLLCHGPSQISNNIAIKQSVNWHIPPLRANEDYVTISFAFKCSIQHFKLRELWNVNQICLCKSIQSTQSNSVNAVNAGKPFSWRYVTWLLGSKINTASKYNPLGNSA